MNNLSHLGEFKIVSDNKKHNSLFFEKYTSVDFILENGIVIKLEGGLIQSISYTSNDNIIICLFAFSPFLYDCMISGNKIKTIRTHELRVDPKDIGSEIECELTYHNFEFTNYSVNENCSNEKYTYVLKGVNANED